MAKKYIILLNDNEQELLEKLLTLGYRRQEIFRIGLRNVYHKEYPPYNKRKEKTDIWDKYTNAEYCVKIRNGRVEGKYCVYKDYAGVVQKIPINRIKILA
jgi:hypothetical protein